MKIHNAPVKFTPSPSQVDSQGAVDLISTLQQGIAAKTTTPAQAGAAASKMLEGPVTSVAADVLKSFVEHVSSNAARPKAQGFFESWRFLTPPPAAYVGFDVHHSVDEARLRNQNPRSVLESVLRAIDPALAQAVHQDSRYAVGLAGAAQQHPELQNALDSWHALPPSAQRENARAFMEVALLPLVAGQASLKGLAADVKAGRAVDKATAVDLVRSAALGHISPQDLKSVADKATGTDQGITFARAFADHFAAHGSVEDGWWAANDAVFKLSAPESLFANALAQFDPGLAYVGHTVLTNGVDHPHAAAAWQVISNGLDGENPASSALAVVKQAYA